MMTLGTGRTRSSARASAFFARWVDHASWSSWSPGTEWVRLEGPLRPGVRGVLKPAGGPRTRFVVSALEPDREYADTSLFPRARLVFRHTAKAAPEGGAVLAVEMTMGGPLTSLWSRVLGGGFQKSAQADLDRLVALVEADASARA